MTRLAALGLLSAGVLGAALGHTRGVRSGMTIGYAYGDRDGERRGDANARLDMVLAAPRTPPFWDAIADGHLRDHVGEDVMPS